MTRPRRNESRRTLARLLMLAFSVLSVLVLVVAASLQLAAHFRTETKALYANQQQIAERAGGAVARFIQEKCRALAVTASLSNPDEMSVAEWDLVLQRLLGLERTFRRVTISEPDGVTVASAARFSPTHPGEGPTPSRTVRFRRPASADCGTLISDVYIDPVTSEPLASIRVPVFSPLREHKKTLTAELNLKFMWDLVDHLDVGQGGHAFVVDESGTLLAFGDTARVLRGENVGHIPTVAEFVKNRGQRTARGVRIYRGIEGAWVVGTYVPLGTPSWAIVTEMPWTGAFGDVIRAAVITALIIVAMAVVASLSGRALARRLAVPLVALKETATRIAGGERSLQASVDGAEEVVDLANAFNSMSSQLQQSILALQAQYAEVAAARDALGASEERLRLAQEGTSDAIWDWDLVEDRVHFGPRLYSMLGYEPDESPVSWQRWLSLLHPEDRPTVERTVQAAAASGEAFSIECRMARRDGDWLWLLTRGKAVAWNDQGRPVRLAGSHADISRRKQAEAQAAALEERLLQAQKMEAVALLAGGIAHDFNNMLSVILGRAELVLRKMGPDDPFRADFTEISTVARRSADLTRQLLAFARQQTIAPKALDLNDTIAGSLRLLRGIARESVELAWKPAAGIWPVKMDPAQVDQMLANLLANARDAIADVGKVVVETGNASFDASDCAVHPGLTPGDYVMLAVSDSGCGMDKETQARVFDPFFTTKQMGKGSGLGLATVHGIVKQNGGFINVYSEPGCGTTFRLYLPRAFASPDAVPEPVGRESLPTGDETILLVEDESSLLQIAIAMLGQLGYSVVAADGPAAALDRAKDHAGPIHLMITDVVMPGMNGRDLMVRLTPARPEMRCLFISGYTADVIARQGSLEEGVHFLQKPFSLQELAVKVRTVLDEPAPGAGP